MGTLLRSAAAFGFDAVVLGPGCASPLSPKTLRSSMGAAGAAADAAQRRSARRAGRPACRGVTTLATALYRSRPLDEAGNDFPGGLCVVIGSEGAGPDGQDRRGLRHGRPHPDDRPRREFERGSGGQRAAVAFQGCVTHSRPPPGEGSRGAGEGREPCHCRKISG